MTDDRRAADRREVASAWLARLHADDCSADERASFETWLSHPPHAAAYAAVEGAWAWAGAAATTAEVQALRAAARDRPHRRFPKQSIAAAVVVTAMLSIAGTALWSWSASRTDIAQTASAPSAKPDAEEWHEYSTAVGERSTVTLGDGSVVFLNTDSRLRVNYSESARHVVLLRGQALFEVVKSVGRPFVVTAGDRRVVALGTAFDVRLEQNRLQVTLIEGRVSVEDVPESPHDTPANRAELEAGQQLIASRIDGVEVRNAPVVRVTSWREGRLIFEDEPLSRAVREMNRYSTTKIRLSDPRLMRLRVSGVFNTGQPQSFVEALVQYFAIDVAPASSKGNIVLISKET